MKNERPAVFHVAGEVVQGREKQPGEEVGRQTGECALQGGGQHQRPPGQLSGGLPDIQGFPEALEIQRQQNLKHQC